MKFFGNIPEGARSYAAKCVLDAVEAWARPCNYLIRETGIVFVGKVENGQARNGRLDGLLVPIDGRATTMKSLTEEYFWNRCCLVGVEVKVSRSDFLHGLKRGQYEQYRSSLGGLYVATPKGICKTSEIPAGIGHLVVLNGRNERAVCARRPQLKVIQYDPDVPWRILFHVAAALAHENAERRQQYERSMDHVGRSLGSKLFALVEQMAEEEGGKA